MTIPRARASVLCFGGWGLQTMLHLWPRLRCLQEERQLLAIAGQIPDLSRITAFAGILTNPVVGADPDLHEPVVVVRPNQELFPEPSFVEERIARREFANAARARAAHTATEQHAAQLFAEANAAGLLSSLDLADQPPYARGLQPDTRMTREEMFKIGIQAAEAIAQAIIRSVIDPTRLDEAQTGDPLVQTTIYVVASLAEPLTSALIWPIVSEIVQRLGSRSTVSVIGLFGVGSFAESNVRILEEAAAFATLRELEALAGLSVPVAAPAQAAGHADGLDQLIRIVRDTGKPGWERRVGQRLFNRLFLIDREKSNQSLARDPHELAVLISNAIESFLVADGTNYIDRHLGVDGDLLHASPTISPHAQRQVYSIIGTANDYIPLRQYLVAAVAEECKRIVRAEMFEAALDHGETSLHELGVTAERVVRHLASPAFRHIIQGERAGAIGWHRRRPAGQAAERWLPQLRVNPSYVLPGHLRQQLQRAAPWEWSLKLRRHVHRAATQLDADIESRAIAQAWGVGFTAPPDFSQPAVCARWGPPIVRAELEEYQRKSWSARHQHDRRYIPAALHKALAIALRDAASGPGGLLTAQRRLSQWIDQIGDILAQDRIRLAAESDTDWQESYMRDHRRWDASLIAQAASQPQPAAVFIRASLIGLAIWFAAFNWLLYESGRPPTLLNLALVGAACIAATCGLAALPLWVNRLRVRRLWNRRVRLATRRLSRNINTQVRNSLARVYQELHDGLGDLERPFHQSIERLRAWSEPIDPSAVLPRGLLQTHLRIARVSEEVWLSLQELVRAARATPAHGSSQAYFQALWRDGASLGKDWHSNGDRLVHALRLALESELNRVQLPRVIALKAWSGQGSPADVEQALRDGTWCGFRRDAGAGQACSACPLGPPAGTPADQPWLPNSGSCAMGCGGRDRWDLAAVVIAVARRATDHLLPQATMLPNRPEFIRFINECHSIEHLLGLSQGGRRDEYWRAFADQMLARAKPAACFEINDQFNYEPIEVGFATTADHRSSPLARQTGQLSFGLLSTHDPLSISMVRTISGLGLDDLRLAERCEREFHSLHSFDRQAIELIHGGALYGDPPPGLVSYDEIIF
ncbi:MAG TPA: hypothetical protein VD886_13405 [Herpetosiphonaceae bacterium]|nr:hypothetical protein [Herpetosiphonaceae bacterium]